ncbi:MAG: hypothetical protein Q4C47_04010 [Planctomycetia bacterium]|nr:hypothetical protein [Planctomycetia bacterium]
MGQIVRRVGEVATMFADDDVPPFGKKSSLRTVHGMVDMDIPETIHFCTEEDRAKIDGECPETGFPEEDGFSGSTSDEKGGFGFFREATVFDCRNRG